MGSVLLIIFDPYSNLIFWVNLTLLFKSPLYKGIGASEVQVRYPQCTSPISNALYIGILALSSEVSEDTTKNCLTLVSIGCPVRLMITISPKASDWQSVTIELAVRRDGLKTIISHFSYKLQLSWLHWP